MKRIIAGALLMAGYSLTTNAQIALPYSNGFDTPSEIGDWIISREGITDEDGSTHTWEPMPSDGAVSAPNMLFHDYPVGYGGEELTDDWLISDKMDLGSGGKLSMKIWVYGINGNAIAGDTIQLYLLKGSRDPGAATKTLIASFEYMADDTGYISVPVWKDTGDIAIPATTGNAYIAFRFTTIFDWFTVGIDDLEITPGATDIGHLPGGKNTIRIYPNPARSRIYWDEVPGIDRQAVGALFNIAGQSVRSFRVADGSVDISALVPGVYVLHIGNGMSSFVKN